MESAGTTERTAGALCRLLMESAGTSHNLHFAPLRLV